VSLSMSSCAAAAAAVLPLVTLVGAPAAAAPAAPAPTVELTAPATLQNGVTGGLTATLANRSGTSQNGVRLRVVLSGLGGLTAQQVVVQAETAPGSGRYASATASSGTTYTVPSSGFSLPSSGTRTLALRFTLARTAPVGTLTTTVTALDSSGRALSAATSRQTSVYTTPGQAAITAVTPGDGQLTVDVRPPSSGNSPVTYVATAVGGGRTVTAGSPTPRIVVGGLVNGTTYAVTVRATNAAGSGPASGTVSAVPVAAPVTLTLSASATFVQYGESASYAGQITRGGAAAGGVPVVLTERYSDGKLVPLGQVTTDAGGAYSLTTRPQYNGTVTVTALGTSASVPSRVILRFTRVLATVRGRQVTVDASTSPGFITGPDRQERVQLLLVDAAGRQLRVLATANAAQRRATPGAAHGVNDVRFRATLPAGSSRVVVKVIGTPVNTGASSAVVPLTLS